MFVCLLFSSQNVAIISFVILFVFWGLHIIFSNSIKSSLVIFQKKKECLNECVQTFVINWKLTLFEALISVINFIFLCIMWWCIYTNFTFLCIFNGNLMRVTLVRILSLVSTTSPDMQQGFNNYFLRIEIFSRFSWLSIAIILSGCTFYFLHSNSIFPPTQVDFSPWLLARIQLG